MSSLFPLLLPLLLGFGLAYAVLRRTSLPQKMLLSLALAAPAGFAVVSIVLFYALLFRAPSAYGVVWAACLTALTFTLVVFLRDLPLTAAAGPGMRTPPHSFWKREIEKWPDRLFIRFLVFGSFLLLFHAFIDFTDYFWKAVSLNIWGEWDARFMWHLKARFLSRDPEEWRNLFSPLTGWKNHDYPLMLPGIISWGWICLGREHPLWPALAAYTFLISLAALLFWHLSSYYSKASGALAAFFLLTLPVLRYWTAALYAETHYVFFSGASLILFLNALRRGSLRLLAASGFMAGAAAWTKNEGLLFLACQSLIFTAVSSRTFGRQARLGKAIAAFAGSGFLFLAACLVLKAFLAHDPSYLFSAREAAYYWDLVTDYGRISLIANSFREAKLQVGWQGLWYLFFAAVIFYPLMRTEKRRPPYVWVSLALAALMEAGYFLIYMISPIEPGYHMSTSLMRLLLHSSFPALFFTFETFSVPGKKMRVNPQAGSQASLAEVKAAV